MRYGILSALCLCMGALFAIGCEELGGLKVPTPGSACKMSSDQEGTLFEPVAHLPITLHLDPKFTSWQKNAVVAAAAQWNRLSQFSFHKDFFAVADARAVPGYANYSTGRDFCGDDSTGSGVFIVGETSVEHWLSLGYSEATAGMTVRCAGGGTYGAPIEQPHMLMMLNSAELSQDLYFGIALHELGHVLGLDHSCLPRAKEGAPSCASLKSNHPYMQAVMRGANDYGAYGDGKTVRIKGTPIAHLEQNDIDRAYCLYERSVGL